MPIDGSAKRPVTAVVNMIVQRDAIAMEPIVPSGMWNIDPIRRGKLLPYRYPYKAVTIPWGLSGIINTGLGSTAGVYYSGALPQTSTGGQGQEFIDDPTNDVVETKSVTQVQMVIQDLGHDYKVGDRFTVLGSDCVLQVTMVGKLTSCSGVDCGSSPSSGPDQTFYDYHDSILRFMVTDPGTNLDYTGLLPSGDATTNVVKSHTQAGAKVVPLYSVAVNGKGFKAYVAQGKVTDLIGKDTKPKIATGEAGFYQLSLPAANFGKESREHDQMVVGSRTVQATIDPELASPDGKYDLFFHFHNDISHTFLSKSDWGTYANNEDQYIELNVNPV